jgi:hypothetical protein
VEEDRHKHPVEPVVLVIWEELLIQHILQVAAVVMLKQVRVETVEMVPITRVFLELYMETMGILEVVVLVNLVILVITLEPVVREEGHPFQRVTVKLVFRVNHTRGEVVQNVVHLVKAVRVL